MGPPPLSLLRRAAIASVAGHGVLIIALLVLVEPRGTAPSVESPLILAELVTVLEPAAAPAPTTSDVTAGSAPAEPSPEQPTPTEPPPSVAPQVVESSPAPPPPELEPERAVEPPTEPPPLERVVEVLEPPAAPVPAEERSADDPVEPLPAAGPSRALASHEERACCAACRRGRAASAPRSPTRR